jgi:hypothetical protein
MKLIGQVHADSVLPVQLYPYRTGTLHCTAGDMIGSLNSNDQNDSRIIILNLYYCRYFSVAIQIPNSTDGIAIKRS